MTNVKKRAKTFGVIATIFFVMFIVIILLIPIIFAGKGIPENDIRITIVNILNIIFNLSILLSIIFTILAVYTSIKYWKKTAPIKHAVKVLYERYAKGEITKEELKQMKKDIED